MGYTAKAPSIAIFPFPPNPFSLCHPSDRRTNVLEDQSITMNAERTGPTATGGEPLPCVLEPPFHHPPDRWRRLLQRTHRSRPISPLCDSLAAGGSQCQLILGPHKHGLSDGSPSMHRKKWVSDVWPEENLGRRIIRCIPICCTTEQNSPNSTSSN